MHIVHVIRSMDRSLGGPPEVAANQAVASARLAHRVSIVCFDPGTGSTALDDNPDGSLVAVWPDAQPSRSRFVMHLRRAVRDADVCHFHSIWSPTFLLGALIARREGTPYVVTPHGSLEPWSLAQSSGRKRAALRLGFRRAFEGAAMLHAATTAEGDNIRRLLPGAPVEVIPHGVNPDRFDPDVASSTQSRLLPAGPFVLFFGRLHYKKAPERLAAAFSLARRSVPELHLVLAGPDDGALAACLDALDPGDVENVSVTGAVHGEDKRSLLRHAVAFGLPSRQEGFSIAVLEALASGTPVLITEACNFPEVSKRGAGVTVSGDPAELAAEIVALVREPTRREDMSRAARSLIDDSYRWDVIGKHLVSAYGRLLSDDPVAT